jgi:hypothetical protein
MFTAKANNSIQPIANAPADPHVRLNNMWKKMIRFINMVWKIFTSIISGEWILKSADNGGAIIALRSLFCGINLYLIVICFINIVDPAKSWTFSLKIFQHEIVSRITWFGVIFAAVYAALYSRFASQWSYLANLYNSIKQASLTLDVKDDRLDILSEWKAAFIEDAEYLHLSHKENFASIIYEWCREERVKEKYIKYTPGGQERFDILVTSINERYNQICSEYKKP